MSKLISPVNGTLLYRQMAAAARNRFPFADLFAILAEDPELLGADAPVAALMQLALQEGGVLSDAMARLPDLIEFAKQHGLKIGTIADLIHFRSRHETLVERSFSKPVRTARGEFILHAYTDRTVNEVHLALTKGNISPEKETLVRVHEPLTVLDFLDTDNGRHAFSLDDAMRLLAQAESGVVVLMHRPESGQDILKALSAVPSCSRPAVKWDPRIYGIGAQILRDLGIRKMRLMASPRRMPSMTGFDLEVTGYVSSPDEPE